MYSGELDFELDQIVNKQIYNFVKLILTELVHPDFYVKPASSTGKYHTESSLGKGGLLRHTRMVCAIANVICTSGMFNDAAIDSDVVTAACILHDGWKYNKDNQMHTTKLHASLAVDVINDYVRQHEVFPVKPNWYIDIMNCIFTHNGFHVPQESMGLSQMNINQRIVHIADMIASRKFLDFKEEELVVLNNTLVNTEKPKVEKKVFEVFDGDLTL